MSKRMSAKSAIKGVRKSDATIVPAVDVVKLNFGELIDLSLGQTEDSAHYGAVSFGLLRELLLAIVDRMGVRTKTALAYDSQSPPELISAANSPRMSVYDINPDRDKTVDMRNNNKLAMSEDELLQKDDAKSSQRKHSIGKGKRDGNAEKDERLENARKGSIGTEEISENARKGSIGTEEISENARKGSIGTEERSENGRKGSIGTDEGVEKARKGSIGTEEISENARKGSIGRDEGVEKARKGSIGTDEGVEKARKGSIGTNEGLEKARKGSIGKDERVEKPRKGSFGKFEEDVKTEKDPPAKESKENASLLLEDNYNENDRNDTNVADKEEGVELATEILTNAGNRGLGQGQGLGKVGVEREIIRRFDSGKATEKSEKIASRRREIAGEEGHEDTVKPDADGELSGNITFGAATAVQSADRFTQRLEELEQTVAGLSSFGIQQSKLGIYEQQPDIESRLLEIENAMVKLANMVDGITDDLHETNQKVSPLVANFRTEPSDSQRKASDFDAELKEMVAKTASAEKLILTDHQIKETDSAEKPNTKTSHLLEKINEIASKVLRQDSKVNEIDFHLSTHKQDLSELNDMLSKQLDRLSTRLANCILWEELERYLDGQQPSSLRPVATDSQQAISLRPVITSSSTADIGLISSKKGESGELAGEQANPPSHTSERINMHQQPATLPHGKQESSRDREVPYFQQLAAGQPDYEMDAERDNKLFRTDEGLVDDKKLVVNKKSTSGETLSAIKDKAISKTDEISNDRENLQSRKVSGTAEKMESFKTNETSMDDNNVVSRKTSGIERDASSSGADNNELKSQQPKDMKVDKKVSLTGKVSADNKRLKDKEASETKKYGAVSGKSSGEENKQKNKKITPKSSGVTSKVSVGKLEGHFNSKKPDKTLRKQTETKQPKAMSADNLAKILQNRSTTNITSGVGARDSTLHHSTLHGSTPHGSAPHGTPHDSTPHDSTPHDSTPHGPPHGPPHSPPHGPSHGPPHGPASFSKTGKTQLQQSSTRIDGAILGFGVGAKPSTSGTPDVYKTQENRHKVGEGRRNDQKKNRQNRCFRSSGDLPALDQQQYYARSSSRMSAINSSQDMDVKRDGPSVHLRKTLEYIAETPYRQHAFTKIIDNINRTKVDRVLVDQQYGQHNELFAEIQDKLSQQEGEMIAFREIVQQVSAQKIDRDYFNFALSMKGDKKSMDEMIDMRFFKKANKALEDSIDNLKIKLVTLERECKWKGAVDNIEMQLNKKAEKDEVISLNKILQNFEAKLNKLSLKDFELYADEAAAFKKQMIPFNCLSCNKNINLDPHKMPLNLPVKGSVFAQRSHKPYTTYELKSIREQLQDREEVYDPYSTPRPVGGNYTMVDPLRHLRQARSVAIAEGLQDIGSSPLLTDRSPHGDISADRHIVLGHDGKIYKGTQLNKLPNVRASKKLSPTPDVSECAPYPTFVATQHS